MVELYFHSLISLLGIVLKLIKDRYNLTLYLIGIYYIYSHSTMYCVYIYIYIYR
jgi:hypothetical protein